MAMRYGFIGLGNLGGAPRLQPPARRVRSRRQRPRHRAAEALLAAGADGRKSRARSPRGSRPSSPASPPPPSPSGCWPARRACSRGSSPARPGSRWAPSSRIRSSASRRSRRKRASSPWRRPVTGGVHKAAAGEITVIVGGERRALERHRAALRGDGRPIFHVGPLGVGLGDQGDHQHARLRPSGRGGRSADARQARRPRPRAGLSRHQGEFGRQLRPRDRIAARPERLLQRRLHHGPRLQGPRLRDEARRASSACRSTSPRSPRRPSSAPAKPTAAGPGRPRW